MSTPAEASYQPLCLELLARLLRERDDRTRWRLIAEFLEEYRWEPLEKRAELLHDEPESTGDKRWDVFLGALGEHLAARDGRTAPDWTASRRLRKFWFPFNTPAARTDAIVHAPAAFRSRGVFVSAHELDVA